MALFVVPLFSTFLLHRAESNDLRLVGGTSVCKGHPQVKHLGSWKDAKFPTFTLYTAFAICRRLNCGSVIYSKRIKGISHSTVEMDKPCVHSISRDISQCVKKDNISTTFYYNITCSDSVRLPYGPRLCSGLLQVNRNQSWTAVCEEDFDQKDAEVVCRELGCGAPSHLQRMKYKEEFAQVRQMFQCKGHETSLMECPRSSLRQTKCDSGKAVVLPCAEPIRLVGESRRCAGTVELRHNGEWKPMYISMNRYEQVAAKVCSLLDCGTPVSANPDNFYLSKPVWWMSPDAARFPDHLRKFTYLYDTTASVGVKVECSESNDLRLVGGASVCKGHPQVKHLGNWKDAKFPTFTLYTAVAICRRLNCGSVIYSKRIKGISLSTVEMDKPCVHSISRDISQCVKKDNISTTFYYNITCSDSVRLRNGPRLCSGLLQVNRNQSWTAVCEEDFDQKDAEVVCRELGCGAPSHLQKIEYKEEFVQVRQMFQCKGHEASLMDCPHSSLSQTKCDSGKAVVLPCAEPIRLVGASGRCAGTVELRHNGEWKPMEISNDQYEQVAAKVCSVLDCGTPVSANLDNFYQSKPVWMMSPFTAEHPDYLREYTYLHDTKASVGVKVECSVNSEGKVDHLWLLWLIPVVVIIITVTILIVCKRKKSSKNAHETTRNSGPSETENVEYDRVHVNEDHIYQHLGQDSVVEEYSELHPQPPYSN